MLSKLTPEAIVIILGLLRREKQRLLGKPVDGVPASPEDQLIIYDEIADELLKDKETSNE